MKTNFEMFDFDILIKNGYNGYNFDQYTFISTKLF